MLEHLIDLDKKLFLFLNSLHTPALDTIMAGISNKYLWIPLYVLFLYWMIRFYRMNAIWIFLSLIAVVAISDLVSVHAFKNVFLRLRPCHDPELSGLVHIVNGKCGGQYGFYSSHATNHFAVAVFTLLVFRGKFRLFTPLILIWAGLIGYSRIYLGVHFPGDVLAGGIAGSVLAVLGFRLLVWIKPSSPEDIRTPIND
jgi:undecaprenyl-diphosphatase